MCTLTEITMGCVRLEGGERRGGVGRGGSTGLAGSAGDYASTRCGGGMITRVGRGGVTTITRDGGGVSMISLDGSRRLGSIRRGPLAGRSGLSLLLTRVVRATIGSSRGMARMRGRARGISRGVSRRVTRVVPIGCMAPTPSVAPSVRGGVRVRGRCRRAGGKGQPRSVSMRVRGRVSEGISRRGEIRGGRIRGGDTRGARSESNCHDVVASSCSHCDSSLNVGRLHRRLEEIGCGGGFTTALFGAMKALIMITTTTVLITGL